MKTNLMAEVKEKVEKLPYEDFLVELNELEGITLLIGKNGKPKAVQIELLAKYEDLFEDFFDVAIMRERKNDSDTITLAQLKANLKAAGKL